MFAEFFAVGGEAAAAAFGVEVVLVPVGGFDCWWCGFGGVGEVLDVVAVDGDEAEDAFGVECCGDAGGASAPVVSGEDGGRDAEGVHVVGEVLGEGCLLAGAGCGGVAEGGGAEAAEVWGVDAGAVCGDGWCGVVVGAGVVGEAVEEDDGRSCGVAGVFVSDVEGGGGGVVDGAVHGFDLVMVVAGWPGFVGGWF